MGFRLVLDRWGETCLKVGFLMFFVRWKQQGPGCDWFVGCLISVYQWFPWLVAIIGRYWFFGGYATLQAAKSFMWLNVGNPHCTTSPFWQCNCSFVAQPCWSSHLIGKQLVPMTIKSPMWSYLISFGITTILPKPKHLLFGMKCANESESPLSYFVLHNVRSRKWSRPK